MTKTLKLAALALFVCAVSFAQTTLTSTTFSSSVAKTDTQVCLTSATGVTLPSVLAPGSKLFADFEPMDVVAQGTSTTCFVVARTFAPAAHVSGATVYLGAPQLFATADRPVGAGCTSTTEYVLPVVNVANGKIFDCRSSGQWIQIGNGTMSTGGAEAFRAFGTGTAGSAETEYLNGAALSGATTATARYVVPSAGTIANLRVYSSANVTGGTSKDVLTVYVNGSASALTCTIAASAAKCSDLTHSVAVSAGDVLTFQFVSATSDTAANISAAVEKF